MVEIRLMGVDLGRRRCGCIRSAMSDWQHWRRYTRLRLVFRQAKGWVGLWVVKGQEKVHCWTCGAVRDHIVPLMVGMGLISPPEGLEVIRRAEETEGRWKAWFKDRTFLGADKEHPDGIYAGKGSDMVCMTNDEWDHWYGGRSDSGGSPKGA